MNESVVELKTYRVRLGHAAVVVRAHHPHEAIELAKRKLSQDMPRLYDVIRTLDPRRFDVDQAA